MFTVWLCALFLSNTESIILVSCEPRKQSAPPRARDFKPLLNAWEEARLKRSYLLCMHAKPNRDKRVLNLRESTTFRGRFKTYSRIRSFITMKLRPLNNVDRTLDIYSPTLRKIKAKAMVHPWGATQFELSYFYETLLSSK